MPNPRRRIQAPFAIALLALGAGAAVATAAVMVAATAPSTAAPAGAAKGKGGPVRVSADLLADDDPAAQTEAQSEPVVAVDPAADNALLAAWEEGRFVDGGSRAIGFASSADGGKTWRQGLVEGLTTVTGGPYGRAAAPAVAFGAGHRAYLAAVGLDQRFMPNGVYLVASPDGGRSWQPPVAVHTANGVESNEKPALAVDRRTDSPYRDRVYVGWDTLLADSGQILLVSHSDDGGQGWSAPAVLPVPRSDGSVGLRLLVGPGGALHAVWLSDLGLDGALLRSATSADGGETWSAPVAIAPVSPAGVAGGHTGAGLPSAAIDEKSGDLWVAWQDDPLGGGVDQVWLARSTNGGAAWTAPVRVSDGPADAPAFTPAVAVNARGQVGVSYYSLRHDPTREALADVYLATAKVAGRAFRNRRVTPVSFDLRAAASSGAFSPRWFVGEGQGLAGGKSLFRLLFVATLERSRQDSTRRQADAFATALAP